MTVLAQKPVPNVPVLRKPTLGWWHELWHRLLLLGYPADLSPPPISDAVPMIRTLVLMLEDHRSQFANAARILGAEYKGGYWMMYLLTPLAVMTSAAAVGSSHYVRLLAGVEFLLIVLILVVFVAMRRGRLQEGWIKARRTAEHLRYLPMVAPFVVAPRENWYEQFASRRGVRVIVDEEISRVCAWLGTAEVPGRTPLHDTLFWTGYIKYVDDVLAQQIHYHTMKAGTEYALARRISRMSTGFFGITIICTALLFLGALTTSIGLDRYLASHYLRFCATTLPALAGGLRGLLAQGESHRVAALSEGMSVRLAQLRADLRRISPTAAAGPDLEIVVWNAVQELLSEADTWMRLQESVPLSVAA